MTRNVESVDLARGELPERLPIPAPRSLDEVLLHLARRCPSVYLAGSCEYD